MSSATESCLGCSLLLDGAPVPVYSDRAHLRHRIAQLDRLIDKASAERSQLQAQSETIVYPIFDLPTEIMSHLFLHCLPDSKSYPHPSSLEAPLLLGQICQQWRNIAIATPGLWQSISLTDPRSLDGFYSWLSRSGQHPLNLDLNCADASIARDMLAACIPHIHRWQNVDLAFPLWTLKGLQIPLAAGAPLLRQFSVSSRRPYATEVDAMPIPLVKAPLLREATIGTYPSLKFDLPWQQLTRLTLERLTIAACFAILKLSPALEALDIGATEPDLQGTPNVVYDITLPALHTIAFPSDVCPALIHLHLPRLRHLHIRETVALDDVDSTALQAFLARSSSSTSSSTAPASSSSGSSHQRGLEQLTLGLKYPASETFARALDAISISSPGAPLRALALQCGNATRVSHLVSHLHAPGVLPGLKVLRIEGGRIFDGDYETLHAMLATRAVRVEENLVVGAGLLPSESVPALSADSTEANSDKATETHPTRALEAFALLVQTYGREEAVRDLPRIRALPRYRELAGEGLKIRIVVEGKWRVGAEVLLDTMTGRDGEVEAL